MTDLSTRTAVEEPGADTLLQASGLSVTLGGREVVSGVDAHFRAGELLGLIGPNGAGKTTLLRALAGLASYRGHVSLDGTPLERLSPRARARQIAFLAQGHHVHWPLTVEALVALGRLPHRRFASGLHERDSEAVLEAMRQADVLELASRRVDRLSGGERARVMLARALAVQAPVLLADEPTASLDPHHQLKIMEVLQANTARRGLVVAVLHDLSLAARYCDRLLLMHEGRLLAYGDPDTVLSDANLRRGFRISALGGREGGARWLVPWRRAGDD